MPQVPIYSNPTVTDKHIAHDYERVNLNSDMIGDNVARANFLLGKAGRNFSVTIKEHVDQYNKAKVVDLSNQIDSYNQQTLYDKDNGYFYKTGKDAAGQSSVILQNYDNYTKDLLENSGLKGQYKQMAIDTIISKRNKIYSPINQHDFKENQSWQNTVYADKQNNILNQAIFDRNDDKLLAEDLRQGYNAIDLQAQLQNWDSDLVNIKKQEFASKYHEGVINSLLADGSPRAKNYYEAHKSEILSDRQASLLNAVTNNDTRYQARNIVNDLIGKNYSLEQAYKVIDGIEDYDLQAAVRTQYEGKLREGDRLQKQEEAIKSQQSWDNVINALKENPENAYLAIDVTQSPEAIKAQMSYIEQMRKFGEIKTGHQVYLDLQEKMTYDAEGFKNTDLNQYRPYLSESDFKKFKEAQDKIGSMEYTIIQEDNKLIDAAIKSIGGHWNTKRVIYSEVSALVKEFENRHGRKINDSELQNIIDSLGYTGDNKVKTYKNIEKGMAEQVGFIKTITNDFAYFEKIHKRQPDAKERAQIIDQRVSRTIQEQNDAARNSLQYRIQNTTAKPNETKELTYYADSYLPKLGRDLGVKFTIVQGGRYRPANGTYESKHSKGEAVDVSMSEHSNLVRARFIESELKNPQVKKIGTSDPYIIGRFGNDPKIVDERDFDKKYGTNHIHHAHITLDVKNNTIQQANANTYKVGNYTVRVKG